MNTQISNSLPSSINSGSSSTSLTSSSPPISQSLASNYNNTSTPTQIQQTNTGRNQLQHKIPEKKDVPVERAEFIRFMSPPAKSSLFISNLPTSVTISEMNELFSQFGLIFSIVAKDGNFLVKYYSTIAAQNAYNQLYGHIYHGYPMRIAFSKQSQAFELKYEQSVELINHYIGFNQWSTEIIAVQIQQCLDPLAMFTEDEKKEFGDMLINQMPALYEFVATIRMVLKDGRSITVDGTSQVESSLSSLELLNHPRKAAITNARKVAFSKLAIVRVDNQSLLHIIDQSIEDQWSQQDQQLDTTTADNQAYFNSL